MFWRRACPTPGKIVLCGASETGILCWGIDCVNFGHDGSSRVFAFALDRNGFDPRTFNDGCCPVLLVLDAPEGYSWKVWDLGPVEIGPHET